MYLVGHTLCKRHAQLERAVINMIRRVFELIHIYMHPLGSSSEIQKASYNTRAVE